MKFSRYGWIVCDRMEAIGIDPETGDARFIAHIRYRVWHPGFWWAVFKIKLKGWFTA